MIGEGWLNRGMNLATQPKITNQIHTMATQRTTTSVETESSRSFSIQI